MAAITAGITAGIKAVNITPTDTTAKNTVSIDQTIGDMEWASREYTGALDPGGVLNCTGAKNLVSGFGEEDAYDEVSVPAYADGGATFTLTGDAILWDDDMEDAGRDLLFVRSPEEVVDDDDDLIDEDGNSVAD